MPHESIFHSDKEYINKIWGMYTTNLKSIQQKYTEQQNYQTHLLN